MSEGKTIVGLCLLLVLLVACEQMPQTPTVTDGVVVKDIPQDPPAFEREYSEQITPDVAVIVKMKTYAFGRSDLYAELKQADGKYVFFSIHRVAEKIIQPELVPLVERSVQKILAMDRAYMETPTREFTDTNGTRWVPHD